MRRLLVALLALIAVMALASPAEAAKKRKVTISVSDRSITVAEAIRVSGKVTPAAKGAKVTIRKRIGGGKWKTVKKVALSVKGTYAFVDRPSRPKSVAYRVQMPKRGGYAGSTSRSLRVKVTKPKARDLTTAELKNAGVPSLCDHPAGRLVGGSLPGIASGQGEVTFVRAVFGELNSTGGRDAAVVIRCNQGGVGWPDHVLLYAADRRGRPVYRGQFDTSSVVGFGRESVRGISLVARRVTVRIAAGERWECMACGTVAVTAQLSLTRSRLTVNSTSRYGAREALNAFLAAANRGDLAAARRLSKQQEYYRNPGDVAVQEVRESGRLSAWNVYGPAPYAPCDTSFSTSPARDCAARNAGHDYSLTLVYGGGWRDWKVTWMIWDD